MPSRRGAYGRRERGGWQPNDRQRRVLDLLVEGKTNADIAARLGITADGAKWHVSQLLTETSLEDRQALAEWWSEQGQQRRIFVPIEWHRALQLRRVHVILAAAGATAALILGVMLLGPSGSGGPNETPPPLGLDVGELGPPVSPSAIVITPAPLPDSDRRPFFMERQLDYDGLATLRVSGGALPHPITIPYVEFENARNTVPGIAGANDYSWYRQAGQSASWERDREVPPPDAGLPRYRVEVIHIGADPGTIDEEHSYVRGQPARADPPLASGWVEVYQPVANLVERYIQLGEAGLLPAEPSLAEAISAAVQNFNVTVSVEPRFEPVEQVPPDKAQQLLSLLGEAEPVLSVMQGGGIGQRGYNYVRLEFTLGPDTLSIYYIPPGGVADQGVLMSQRFLNAWGFVTAVTPPGYWQRVYSVAPAFDALMAELGFPGRPLEPTIKAWIEPPAPNRWRLIDRIEMWREGEPRVELSSLERQPCFQGCPLEVAQVPSQGKSLRVAIWPTGNRPFPEAVRPALYDYYVDDGSGRGVLVETEGPGILSAWYASRDVAFYPPPPLDELLKQGALSLR